MVAGISAAAPATAGVTTEPTAHPAPVSAPAAGGATTIAESVVAKIASQAASEVSHVGGRRRVPGAGSGTRRVRPRAGATVDGRVARITLKLSVEYPTPVRATTRAVRTHVVERLAAFAAIDAQEVDITVVALPDPETDGRALR